jgi:hypothetical protein
VDDPNTDYSKFKIPKEHSIITLLATRLLRKQKENLNTILEECQKSLYYLHANPNFHHMCHSYIPIPDFNKSNEYEMQAYHNTLYPITKLIFDKTRDMWKKLPDSNNAGQYPLPTYLCIADVVLRESPRPHQVIDCIIEGATCPDDLKRMNNSLFHAKHTEMLTISMTTMSAIIDNVPINQFDWNAGEGIAALKSGLTRAPHLKILAFRDLLKPFDERNILAIADIIIARQKTKNMKPFTEIRFAERTLSQDVAVKFMEALKDYPVPLVVFLSPRDNNFIMNGDEDYDGMEVPFSTPQMKQFNKKLQLRWGDNYSGNMKLDASWGVNEYAVMHTWTKELEIIKSLSQRPKQE